MSKKVNLNEDKNKIEVSPEKLKKLGLLKVLGVVISEDEETKYRCITEDGEVVFISSSELLSEEQ